MSRLRHEAGQTVVLFAILLPLFLGLGAIAVDIGYWYVVKKTAQDAADAAALAAARELPGGCSEAEVVGHDYGTQNMPDATVVDVTTPCEDPEVESDSVRVAVTAKAETFFGRLFGLLDVTVTQQAMAERLDRPGDLAIFAHDESCDDPHPLEFAAQNVFISGRVHTNGRFRISNGPFWAANGTFDDGACRPSIEPEILTQFGESKPPPWGSACGGGPCREPLEGDYEKWPAWFTPADAGWFTYCTFQGETIEVTAQEVKVTGPDLTRTHDGTLPSGTYCATESFTLTGDGVRGAITVLAPTITVSANNTRLRPYSGTDLLFFAIPNNDLAPGNDGSLASDGEPYCQLSPAPDVWLSGENAAWSGIVFHPCGRVVTNISGTPALTGAIVAEQVSVLADGFDMVGEENFAVQTALVE